MKKRFAWLFGVMCLLVASVALAAGKAKGVVIIIEGTDVEITKRELADAIPEGLQVMSAGDLYAAFGNHGVSGSLADSLANPKTRKQTLAGVRKSLADAGVAAVISARSKKVGRGGARDVRIVLVVGSQTEPVVEENIAVGKGEKGASKFQPLLSVPLQEVATSNAQPAATDDAPKAVSKESKETKEKEKDKEADAPAPPSEDEAPTDRDEVAKPHAPVDFRNAMIVADVSGGVGRRSFTYSSMVKGPLRSYTAPGVGLWNLGAEVYPFATQGTPGVKDLGVVGRLSGALRWNSATADGQTISGAWSRYAVGARYRLPLGDGSGPMVGLEGTYGGWKFDFFGEGMVTQEVPSVDYRYVRGAADIRVPFGAFSLLGGAGYMYILSAGPFTDRFPHATMMGVDARVGAAYAVLPWLQIKGTAEYERIFASLHPKLGEGAPAVAGGSLDQYFIFNLGVSAIF